MRQLEREIGRICRKVRRRIAEGHKGAVRVSLKNLHEFLGAPKIIPEEVLKKDQIGVATGLAWTAVGGDVLFIEALRVKGKGILVLTGQLGEVMRESAQAAFSYAKSRAKELEISDEDFSNYDLHIHIPEGAIPKDGPSAGITLATAMVSALSLRPVLKSVAMTGEITLTLLTPICPLSVGGCHGSCCAQSAQTSLRGCSFRLAPHRFGGHCRAPAGRLRYPVERRAQVCRCPVLTPGPLVARL